MEMGSPAWKVHPLCIAMNPSMYQYIDWSGSQIWPLVLHSPDVAVIDQPQAQFFKKSDLWALDNHKPQAQDILRLYLWPLTAWDLTVVPKASCVRRPKFGGRGCLRFPWNSPLTSLNPNPEHLTFLQGASRQDHQLLQVTCCDQWLRTLSHKRVGWLGRKQLCRLDRSCMPHFGSRSI